MPPLIAFDLDGTLVDSQRDLAESANEMLAEYGANPLAVSEVAAMVGDGARQLVARVLEAARKDADVSAALEMFLGIYAGRLVAHTRPYLGVVDALQQLSPRASLAVLTNKPGELSRRILEAFDMARFFPWIVGGDSTFGRKPNPAGLLHLMASAGASSETTIMVGDSMVDLETARGAGVAVCVAHYGFGHLRRPIELRGDEVVVARATDLGRALSEWTDGR